MDYKKAYEEALERAKQGLPIDEVFPELRESEDEKIRKQLIKEVMEQIENIPAPDCCDSDDLQRLTVLQSWLAYLERQKEQNHDGKKWIREKDYNEQLDAQYAQGYEDGKKEQKPVDDGKRAKIISRAENEKQVVLISESNGNAEIGWDTRSLEDAKKLLEYGIVFINKQLGMKPAEWNDANEQNLNVCLSYINDEALRQWLKDAIHVNYTKPAEWSEDIIRKAVKEIGLTQHQIDWFKANVFPSKQEWGKEDEKMLNKCIHAIEGTRESNSGWPIYISEANWLKFLPKRFNLQSNQEWSEEDEKNWNEYIERLKAEYSKTPNVVLWDDINWLEYLHERLKSLRPKPHWKPSKEQMFALNDAVFDHIASCEKTANILESLYNDLQKLL